MFTGIIETIGIVQDIISEGTNIHFLIRSDITHQLSIDQSIAHNGVCLTVVELKDDTYKVTAIEETLKRTNLKYLRKGDTVNLERCMPANGRYDGHIVQGHVDVTATCREIENRNGSWLFSFELTENTPAGLMVDKGSICVNGISLTIVLAGENMFTVAIIPYTFDHTNLRSLQVGNLVNIEFDIIGKYVQKMLSKRFLI